MATATTAAPRPKRPVAVDKPTPYTFDLSLLLANDHNPAELPTGAAAMAVADAAATDAASSSATVATVATALDAALRAVARDGAQALINQVLTTCRIERTAGAGGAGGDEVALSLPGGAGSAWTPREKPVPQPKPPTRWQQFATRKGIAPKTREQRRNLQYNATTGTWERRWGHQAAANRAAAETDWVVEVKEADRARDAEHAANGTSFRGDARRERKERVRRNERKMRRNQEHAARS